MATVHLLPKKLMENSSTFEPSMRILSRIMQILLTKNSIGRTALSQQANVNYARLSKHLDWLEEKSMVEIALEDRKIIVKLTKSGSALAEVLLKDHS